MGKNLSKISKNTEDTNKIANDFLTNVLKVGDKKPLVIGLYGDLGVGKTTFVKNIAKMLSIKRKVNSPTFVIMKKYSINFENYKFLFHIDAYRLKNSQEIINLGWRDIISNPENIIFIEWPEKVSKAMPKKHHRILISHTPKGDRNFKIKIAQ